MVSAGKFTDLCGGLDTWNHLKIFCSEASGIKDYESLKQKLPNIQHERILLSRLPLYQKWHGGKGNIKDIFVKQVQEYILMGYIVSRVIANPVMIIASDHKAMRKYYNSFSDQATCGSNIEY